jgi:FKBP-type peptidyl-prolyl cis-trans isomerase
MGMPPDPVRVEPPVILQKKLSEPEIAESEKPSFGKMIAIIAVCVLVAGGIGYFWLNNRSGKTKVSSSSSSSASSALLYDDKGNGEKFMNENKTKDGVITCESGLQYKVLKQGDGIRPKPEDEVVVRYSSSMLNDKAYLSSYEPPRFKANQGIKGFVEGLQLMPAGSKYIFWLPPELAYGEQGNNTVRPNCVIVIEMELLEVIPGTATADDSDMIYDDAMMDDDAMSDTDPIASLDDYSPEVIQRFNMLATTFLQNGFLSDIYDKHVTKEGVTVVYGDQFEIIDWQIIDDELVFTGPMQTNFRLTAPYENPEEWAIAMASQRTNTLIKGTVTLKCSMNKLQEKWVRFNLIFGDQRTILSVNFEPVGEKFRFTVLKKQGDKFINMKPIERYNKSKIEIAEEEEQKRRAEEKEQRRIAEETEE